MSAWEDAVRIWRAGIEAVRGDRLVRGNVLYDSAFLQIGPLRVRRDHLQRIVVVGAGKASATMASGLEQALEDDADLTSRIVGWVNVPEGSGDTLQRIHLEPVRPRGSNLPTSQAVRGTHEIQKLVRECQPGDLVVVLISGGASALLVDPVPGVSLESKT
ncbi:MAG TPA: DUF4147 domain-containing protein, partial [Pirellulaceae bacterium]